MFATARRTLPVLGLVVALNAGGGDAPASASPSHTLTGFTTAQEATIGWALGLFDEAGLPLPGIDFVLHTTVEPCHGRRGWYSSVHDQPVIHVCTHEGGPVPEPLILHELAHAWDGHRLTDRRRAAYLDWRGLSQWWGQEREHWGEYGAEQAAETIVWGAIDRPIRASQIPPPTTRAATCGPRTTCSPAARPSTATRSAAGWPSRGRRRRQPPEPWRPEIARAITSCWICRCPRRCRRSAGGSPIPVTVGVETLWAAPAQQPGHRRPRAAPALRAVDDDEGHHRSRWTVQRTSRSGA